MSEAPPGVADTKRRYADHCNTHGLVDGDVPAGKQCPYWDVCQARTENCPAHDNQNLRPHGFSCALARAFSMMLIGAAHKQRDVEGVYPMICMHCQQVYKYVEIKGSTGLCDGCLAQV